MASTPFSPVNSNGEECRDEASTAGKEERQTSADPDPQKSSIVAGNFRPPPSQFRSKKKMSSGNQMFKSTSLPPSAISSPRSSDGSFRGEKPARLWSMYSDLTPAMRKWSFLRPGSFNRARSCHIGERTCDYSDEFELGKTMSRDGSGYSDARTNSFGSEHNSSSSRSGSEEKYCQPEYKLKKSMNDDGAFHCGAMCMFLPGLSKGKQVKKETDDHSKGCARESEVGGMMASTRVSLEKFECGSWRSSAVADDDAGSQAGQYFDLPSELIRSNGNDTTSPVSTAFVFSNDKVPGLSGVLKKSTSSFPRRSIESSRHVRFSLSSQSSSSSMQTPSTCVQNVREDFSAYLEASS
ncbi:unnamed protein product [Victoria cruziana]